MNKFRLDGVVGFDLLAEDVEEKLDGDSHIVVNSGGGSIPEGFSIMNAIKNHDGVVNIEVDFAASMASVFPMAANRVTMHKESSVMMIHRPFGGSIGNADEHRQHAESLQKMEEMIVNIYMDKTGLSESKIGDMLSAETWLTAQEAFDNGFIDEVIDGGKQDFESVAFAAMAASSQVNFDSGKFLNKVHQIKSMKSSTKTVFRDVKTLKDVESSMRKSFNLSYSDATEIVSAVKKVLGDREQYEKLENLFDNYKFKVKS